VPDSPPVLPTIAVVGMSLEASVYSPARTRIDDFVCRTGDEIVQTCPYLAPGSPVGDSAHWLPLVHYRSIPGGAVPAEDFGAMCDRILTALAQAQRDHGPLDGVLLDLHGAMSVVGVDDPEGRLAASVRGLVGRDTLISTGMDLHGNVSWQLARSIDLLTCYRMAPHEDALDTKERAARNLVARLALPPQHRRPVKAWVPVPILLPGEMTSTRIEPAKSLYANVAEIEAMEQVVDAAIWIGYPWADEPRNHAVIMVLADAEQVAAEQAERLARAVWEVRAEFSFVAPSGTLEECLHDAFTSRKTPYFISDSGDNPTAGGAGDVSWTLARLLQRPEFAHDSTGIYASIPDPAAVAACVQAGVGASVDLKVGALVDDTPAPPATLRGTVERIVTGDQVAQIEVVVASGNLRVILTEHRKPYHLESDFTRLGLDPRTTDVTIIKIGYLEPELFAMANGWMLALTPGGVDQDLSRLGHHRVDRPIFPLDPEMADPDLSARLVPAP